MGSKPAHQQAIDALREQVGAGPSEVQKAPTDHLYWARSSSVNAAPPPKPMSADEVAALQAKEAASSGSTWNKAQTWEEKPINQWAIALLTDTLLPAVAYELPAVGTPVPPPPQVGDDAEGLAALREANELALKVRVSSVEKVTGEATYVVSRGKQRCVFELALKVKLEMEVRHGEALKTILTGSLHVPEVSNDDLGDAKLPTSKVVCGQSGWKPFFEQAAKASWPALQTVFTELVEQAKERWK